jgi:hypothetical protein
MSNTLFQWKQLGSLRAMQPNGTATEGNCQPPQEPQIILMGSGITDGNGEWVLTVLPALCPTPTVLGVEWVSLVATPSLFYRVDPGAPPPPFPPLQAEYVTTAWSLENQLTLYVKSWQGNGERKGGVPFSWHAVVLQRLG